MSFVKTAKFNSLEEMLEHLRSVVTEAEAAEAAQAGSPEVDLSDDDIEISDFDLRRAVVKAVIDNIGFNSPEDFAKYVSFIYEFMVAGTDE